MCFIRFGAEAAALSSSPGRSAAPKWQCPALCGAFEDEPNAGRAERGYGRDDCCRVFGFRYPPVGGEPRDLRRPITLSTGDGNAACPSRSNGGGGSPPYSPPRSRYYEEGGLCP